MLVKHSRILNTQSATFVALLFLPILPNPNDFYNVKDNIKTGEIEIFVFSTIKKNNKTQKLFSYSSLALRRRSLFSMEVESTVWSLLIVFELTGQPLSITAPKGP